MSAGLVESFAWLDSLRRAREAVRWWIDPLLAATRGLELELL